MGSAVALAALLACSPMVMTARSTQAAAAETGKSMKKSMKKDMKNQSYNPRNFSGVWETELKMFPKDQPHILGPLVHKPPFTKAGMHQYELNVKFNAAGDVTNCDPYGVTRNFFTPRPFEIIYDKDGSRILQHWEYYDNWRTIWMDGRKKPANFSADFRGFSTGHWDGNTLVVKSSGYNGLQFLAWNGIPLSTEMHQTERWTRISKNILKIVFTFNDPKYYTKPWHLTYYAKREPTWQLIARPCTLTELQAWDKLGHKDGLPGLEYKGPR